MSVRSRSLWRPTLVGTSGTPTDLYTAPAGYFVVVKSVRVVNTSTDPAMFFMGVDGVMPSGALWWDVEVPPGVLYVDAGWSVLPDGATVTAWADAADAIAVSGSGAVLGP